MDEVTLERLRKLLGETDVWADPKPVVEPPTDHDQLAMDFSHNPESDLEEGAFDYDFGGSQSQPQPSPSRRRKKAGRGDKASSTTPGRAGPRRSLADLDNVQFAAFSGNRGDMGNKDMRYTPLTMAVNYPIQYIGNANREKAAPFFKLDTLLDRMTWDFFYIWHPSAPERCAPRSTRADSVLVGNG